MAAPKYDHEHAWKLYYNEGGVRRKLQDVADMMGASYHTVAEWSAGEGWAARADAVDDEARAETDRKLAVLIGKQRAGNIQVLAALQSQFAKRLMEKLPDGAMNPHYLQPSELSVADYERALKLMELLTGGATERGGVEADQGDEHVATLAELEDRIAAMDKAERIPSIEAGLVDIEVVEVDDADHEH